MPRLTIAVVSEQRSSYLQDGFSQEDCAALTHDGEVEGIVTTLKKLGHHVVLVRGIRSLVQHLANSGERDWDLVFNIAQGFFGSAREAQVPALLEAYEIPYTFADAATIALCQNKSITKIVLDHHHIPSAPFTVISTSKHNISDCILDSGSLTFPLFVKLATEGSSKGVDSFSKVDSPAELRTAVKKLAFRFPDHEILVESFLAGREFTVSLLGTGPLSRVIGVREHVWQESSSSDHENSDPDTQNFASWQSKSSRDFQLKIKDYNIQETTDPQIHAACLLALETWAVLDCRDAGRVDIRFDSCKADSTPFVLEVNPIAGLLPGLSPLPASAEANGISFEELLVEIIESALLRISAVQKN
ncbi:D-alanine--D-alanine ligase family protein [Aspergillus affinis]|uniref:D-alanine--D-alanine ligase family protein n=1 Tax=Aspergillus affinis TaxID=1070780 RepID=UPI0022FEE379|nr:glutathione synthetase ATP-binding domain-like protein [Aspergillus affinis]KAI9036460.1 glutathione synthetase ATP-binding domain-like protein [Aspergillus affinis]